MILFYFNYFDEICVNCEPRKKSYMTPLVFLPGMVYTHTHIVRIMNDFVCVYWGEEGGGDFDSVPHYMCCADAFTRPVSKHLKSGKLIWHRGKIYVVHILPGRAGLIQDGW